MLNFLSTIGHSVRPVLQLYLMVGCALGFVQAFLIFLKGVNPHNLDVIEEYVSSKKFGAQILVLQVVLTGVLIGPWAVGLNAKQFFSNEGDNEDE